MKAIILAAGKSTRLRPLTNEIPKTLLKVNNKPIISHILDSLDQNSVKNVIICVGYRASQIIEYCKSTYPKMNIFFVENKDYSNTNNMYSLYLARKYFDDDLILFNGDCIHDPTIIKEMIKQQKTTMAVDTKSYHHESMKICVNKNGIIEKMGKTIPPEQTFGCSVDIFKISKNDLKSVRDELERFIEKEKNLNEWIEAMFEKLFKNKIIKASTYDVSGKNWYEIDTFEDLEEARSLFNNN